MTHHWEILYERPPLSRDAMLFGLALALHSPLFFFHLQAPKLSASTQHFVNVKMIDQIPVRPTVIPTIPRIPTAPKQPADVDMEQYKKILEKIQNERQKPLAAPAATARPADIKTPEATAKGPEVSDELRRAIMNGRNGFAAPKAPTGGPGIKMGDSAAAGPVVTGVRDDGPAAPTLEGKGGFAVGRNQITGVGGDGGLRTKGGGEVVQIQLARAPSQDEDIFAPVSTGKSHGSIGGGTGPAGSGDGGLVGTGSAGFRGASTVRSPFLITGPLRDRKLLESPLPVYPSELRSKAIEASVRLKFTVTPDGRVKDGVLVLETSGYPSMDNAATAAIRKWLFGPLPTGNLLEQVGTITMRFSVR